MLSALESMNPATPSVAAFSFVSSGGPSRVSFCRPEYRNSLQYSMAVSLTSASLVLLPFLPLMSNWSLYAVMAPVRRFHLYRRGNSPKCTSSLSGGRRWCFNDDSSPLKHLKRSCGCGDMVSTPPLMMEMMIFENLTPVGAL